MTDRKDWPPPPIDIRKRGRGGPGGGRGFRAYGAPAGEAAGPAPMPGAGLNISSPYEVRPPQGTDFLTRGYQAGVAAGAAVVLPGSQYQIPDGEVGVIRSISLVINNLLLTSNIIFRIRADGSPLSGWGALQPIPGAVAYWATVYGPEETFIRLPDRATVDVEVQVFDAAVYDLGAALKGWHFSKGLADAADRAWMV